MGSWNGTRCEVIEPVPSSNRPHERGLLTVVTRAVLLSALIVGLTAGSVFAANGGRGSASTIDLVIVNASQAAIDGTGPRHGDTVTFNVSTTATDRPYVVLDCYQAGAWVYAAQAGFWATYPGGQNFVLAASSWAAGAASCTARLGLLNADGTKYRELASTRFDVSE